MVSDHAGQGENAIDRCEGPEIQQRRRGELLGGRRLAEPDADETDVNGGLR